MALAPDPATFWEFAIPPVSKPKPDGCIAEGDFVKFQLTVGGKAKGLFKDLTLATIKTAWPNIADWTVAWVDLALSTTGSWP